MMCVPIVIGWKFSVQCGSIEEVVPLRAEA